MRGCCLCDDGDGAGGEGKVRVLTRTLPTWGRDHTLVGANTAGGWELPLASCPKIMPPATSGLVVVVADGGGEEGEGACRKGGDDLTITSIGPATDPVTMNSPRGARCNKARATYTGAPNTWHRG